VTFTLFSPPMRIFRSLVDLLLSFEHEFRPPRVWIPPSGPLSGSSCLPFDWGFASLHLTRAVLDVDCPSGPFSLP